MTSKTKQRFHLSTGVVAIAAVVIALVAAISIWWQLSRYEDNLLEIFAKQQDQYIALAVDQINLEQGRSDDDIIGKVLGSISGSTSQYWTLSKKNSLIFVKDVTDSSRYRGFSTKTYYSTDSAASFVAGLTKDRIDHAIIQIDGNDYIASGTVFSYGDDTYRLCLLTGKHVVIDQNAYLAARVNVGVTVAVVLIVFVVACVGMSLRGDALNRRLRATEDDNRELRRIVERLNNEIMGRKPFDTEHSLFSVQQISTLLGKLGPAGKLPATLVSLQFDSITDRDAFMAKAAPVFDNSVVRFADGCILVLVFIAMESSAAKYALSLVDGCPEAMGIYEQREGDELAWDDIAGKIGIDILKDL